jgi:predicted dehydrogenase
MELTGGACVNATLGVGLADTPANHFSLEIHASGAQGYLVIRNTSLYGKKSDAEVEELLYSENESILLTHAKPKSPKHWENVQPPQLLLQGLFKLVENLQVAFLSSNQSNDEQKSWDKSPVASSATFEDAQYVMAAIEAIKKSNLDKQWVPVQLLAENNETEPNGVIMEPNLSSFYVSL